MIQFKEYLTELFDRPAQLSSSRITSLSAYASFETKHGRYGIDISEWGESEDIGYTIWDIQFYFIPFKKTDRGIFDASNLMDDRNLVLATVIKFVEDWYKKHKQDEYRFSCAKKEPSKVKLYDVLAKKFASKYNLQVRRDDYGGDAVWVISR